MTKKRGVEQLDWHEHWQGMPEFVQEEKKPYACIKVRFENQKALEDFSCLIGQKLTHKTKAIWHPGLVRGKDSGKRYIDEP